MGTNTNLAMEIYSKAVIKGLTVKLPALKRFALDLSDETPLPAICDLSEDGTCEACQ